MAFLPQNPAFCGGHGSVSWGHMGKSSRHETVLPGHMEGRWRHGSVSWGGTWEKVPGTKRFRWGTWRRVPGTKRFLAGKEWVPRSVLKRGPTLGHKGAKGCHRRTGASCLGVVFSQRFFNTLGAGTMPFGGWKLDALVLVRGMQCFQPVRRVVERRFARHRSGSRATPQAGCLCSAAGAALRLRSG